MWDITISDSPYFNFDNKGHPYKNTNCWNKRIEYHNHMAPYSYVREAKRLPIMFLH